MPRVHLIANLLDEDADGKRRRISQFAINPELRNGLATETPVVPGERYTLEPPGFAMAHHLRAGHRLVLRVTTSDPGQGAVLRPGPERHGVHRTRGDERDRPGGQRAVARTGQRAAGRGRRSRRARAAAGRGHGHDDGARRGRAVDGVTSEYFEFDVSADHDNATMEGVATPARRPTSTSTSSARRRTAPGRRPPAGKRRRARRREDRHRAAYARPLPARGAQLRRPAGQRGRDQADVLRLGGEPRRLTPSPLWRASARR